MEPSHPAAIDMRHTKLKASEAALLAGELVKPTWASRNEGIHERVSFEDTLWGFEMAGGAFYKTPLRVVYVRPDSRAERACIRMGDTVLRISGRDTIDMTLQEAHQLVLEAGINLKIAVTSPEDKINAHYDYEDPMMQSPQLTPEQLKQMELDRVRRALERASRCRELTWPWVTRNWAIYRESNCFLVPSKYENKHKDKFSNLPAQKLDNFFPAEKNIQMENKNTKDNAETLNENKVIEPLNDDEKNAEVVEEVGEEKVQEEKVEEEKVEEEKVEEEKVEEEKIEEEKVEEEKVEEEKVEEEKVEEEKVEEEKVEEEMVEEENIETNDEISKQEGSERLKDTTTENQENSSEKNGTNKNPEEISPNSLEAEIDNLDTNICEDLQRKDSNQSAASYELDNNNNHVVKHKNEESDEESRENDHSDDQILDEIVENSNELLEKNFIKSDEDTIDSVLNDNIGSDLQNES